MWQKIVNIRRARGFSYSSREQGGALVEAAAVLPLMMLFITGLYQIGQSLAHAIQVDQIAYSTYMAGSRTEAATRSMPMYMRFSNLLSAYSRRPVGSNESFDVAFPWDAVENSERTIQSSLNLDVKRVSGELVSRLPFSVGAVRQTLTGPSLAPRMGMVGNLNQFQDPPVNYDCSGAVVQHPVSC